MTKDSMILVKSTWNDKQTFRTVPVTSDCPYVECIWDPTQKVFVVIAKIAMTKMHMLPRLDDNGDQVLAKGIRKNGRMVKEERKTIETFQEYYIEDKEAIDLILNGMCSNVDAFDYKSFLVD